MDVHQTRPPTTTAPPVDPCDSHGATTTVLTGRPARAERRRTLRGWQVDADREISALKAGLERAANGSTPPELGFGLDEIRRAQDVVDADGARLRSWWTGARVDRAFSAIHAAEGWLVIVESDAELRATLPGLRASVESTIHQGDSRRQEYLRYLTQEIEHPSPSLDHELLRCIKADVRRIGDNSQTKLRRFRNHLLVVALLTVFVALLVPTVAAFHGHFDVVCAPESSTTRTAGADLRLCPEGTNHADGESVWLIELFGALGGLMTILATIQRIKPHQVTQGWFYAQLILKVGAGALTGLLGVIIIQNGVIDGVQAQAAWAVFAYVFIFGVAQDTVTRFVDRKGSELLGEAETKNDVAYIGAS